MSQELSKYLSGYIESRVGVYKKYLMAALDNTDQCIWYLESSVGMLVPSSDLKNLQLLRDAQLFTEDMRISRNGRNTYKIYCLTELGKKLAAEIKKEGLEGKKPERTP